MSAISSYGLGLDSPVEGRQLDLGFDSPVGIRKAVAEVKPRLVRLVVLGSLTGITAALAPASVLDWTSSDAIAVRVANQLSARVVPDMSVISAVESGTVDQALSLAAVCAEMRALIDLPVQDLARMVGIGRRQFYNLMNGETPAMRSSEDERRLRQVHDQLKSLSSVSHGDSSLRSAVLTPLPDLQGKSFFDAAESGDTQLLETGSKIQEQLPPSGTFPSGDPRWKDAAAVLFDDSSTE